MSNHEPHVTTFKMAPRIGSGMRILAAIQKKSVADVAEEAVRRILSYHKRPAAEMPPKSRTGRPGTTVKQAAEAILRSKPTRNDAIPTRIAPDAARELEQLAEELETRMNYLAEEGAIRLLKEGPKIAKDIAGLNSDEDYEKALGRIREVASGNLSEDDFVRLSGAPRRRNSTGTTHAAIEAATEDRQDAKNIPKRAIRKPAAGRSVAPKAAPRKMSASERAATR